MEIRFHVEHFTKLEAQTLEADWLHCYRKYLVFEDVNVVKKIHKEA